MYIFKHLLQMRGLERNTAETCIYRMSDHVRVCFVHEILDVDSLSV
jgi:hypothetical protein